MTNPTNTNQLETTQLETDAQRAVRQKAHELVNLAMQQKELSDRIKVLKAEILEYTNINNLSETSWGVGASYVEVATQCTYRVNHDVPVKIEIDDTVCSPDVAEECLTAKLSFNKTGKRVLLEGTSKDLNCIADITVKKKVVVHL